MVAVNGAYLLTVLIALLPTAAAQQTYTPCFANDLSIFDDYNESEIIIPANCTTVEISNLRMPNHLAGSLAKALKANVAVNTLLLRDIEVADDGVVFFANALKTNTAITNFSLGFERYNEGIGDAAVASFAEAIKVNTALTSFALTRSGGRTNSSVKVGISDNGMVLLSQALISNAAITELNLESNGISDAGAASLAGVLKVNGAIARLHLGNNLIRSAGATAIADAIAANNNTAIALLSLGEGESTLAIKYVSEGNIIGDTGAAALAKALGNNTVLAEINLNYNNIGDVGAAALAEAISANSALTHIGLYGNKIGDVGAAAFAEAIALNATLGFYAGGPQSGAITSLDLGRNRISNAGAALLAQALTANTNITSLRLQYNRLTFDSSDLISSGWLSAIEHPLNNTPAARVSACDGVAVGTTTDTCPYCCHCCHCDGPAMIVGPVCNAAYEGMFVY